MNRKEELKKTIKENPDCLLLGEYGELKGIVETERRIFKELKKKAWEMYGKSQPYSHAEFNLIIDEAEKELKSRIKNVKA